MPVLTWDVELGEQIRQAREAKGWSQPDLARKAGTNQQTIDRLESGETKRSKYLPDVLKVLGLDDELSLVPLVGYAGAGSQAHYYDGGDPPDDWVRPPPNKTEKTVAIEIRGESLGQVFNKWLIYYDDVRRPALESMLRKLCVVGLSDGRVLVKQLLRGSIPGRWHLASVTETMIEDVVIEWAAEVKAILPRDGA